MGYVHTLGDSTLDNYYWMLNQDGSNEQEAKDKSVEGQLESILSEVNYKVVSHAYDGFTTSSVLEGDDVGSVLGIQAKHLFSEKHPFSKKDSAYLTNRFGPTKVIPSNSYFVDPLNDLKQFISSKPNSKHYVVISVGGNDFRERLGNPIEMLRDIPKVQERYLDIVAKVNGLKEKNVYPILMFQYRVDANNDCYYIYRILKAIGSIAAAVNLLSIATITTSVISLAVRKINLHAGIAFAVIGTVFLLVSTWIIPFKVTKGILSGQEIGMATLGGVMERFYRPIVAQAKKDNIPILDLPNIFNPYKSYYIAGIEPNEEGGELIAKGINNIVKNHDFTSESKIYSDTKSKVSDPATWQVNYPSIG